MQSLRDVVEALHEAAAASAAIVSYGAARKGRRRLVLRCQDVGAAAVTIGAKVSIDASAHLGLGRPVEGDTLGEGAQRLTTLTFDLMKWGRGDAR